MEAARRRKLPARLAAACWVLTAVLWAVPAGASRWLPPLEPPAGQPAVVGRAEHSLKATQPGLFGERGQSLLAALALVDVADRERVTAASRFRLFAVPGSISRPLELAIAGTLATEPGASWLASIDQDTRRLSEGCGLPSESLAPTPGVAISAPRAGEYNTGQATCARTTHLRPPPACEGMYAFVAWGPQSATDPMGAGIFDRWSGGAGPFVMRHDVALASESADDVAGGFTLGIAESYVSATVAPFAGAPAALADINDFGLHLGEGTVRDYVLDRTPVVGTAREFGRVPGAFESDGAFEGSRALGHATFRASVEAVLLAKGAEEATARWSDFKNSAARSWRTWGSRAVAWVRGLGSGDPAPTPRTTSSMGAEFDGPELRMTEQPFSPRTEPSPWKGPTDYSHLKDPVDIVKRTKPTSRQVAQMKAANRAHNDGLLRDDMTGELMVDSARSQSGITPPTNEAQVDHKNPVSSGGTRSFTNLQLITRLLNRLKWDTAPAPPE